MQHTIYHSLLRISSVVVAFVLLFDSGLLAPGTDQLSKNTQNYLANAVGISASVEPTELNMMTAELTKRSVALDVREQELVEREIAVEKNTGSPVAEEDYSTFILSLILFILLTLIILNYGLDYARMRRGDLVYVQNS